MSFSKDSWNAPWLPTLKRVYVTENICYAESALDGECEIMTAEIYLIIDLEI